jgi:hypothetical protein
LFDLGWSVPDIFGISGMLCIRPVSCPSVTDGRVQITNTTAIIAFMLSPQILIPIVNVDETAHANMQYREAKSR